MKSAPLIIHPTRMKQEEKITVDQKGKWMEKTQQKCQIETPS
jgi:hypothetical protein